MADPALNANVLWDNGRQRALDDIQFASIVDADLTPSEDETPEDGILQLETVQSAIGVSIGQQQTRLTSPKTPAAEKAAALDETDGGALFEGWQDQGLEDGTDGQNTPQLGSVESHDEEGGSPNIARTPVEVATPPKVDSPIRLPSPWRASPKQFQRTDDNDHRAVLRSNLKYGPRRRAMSGGSAAEALRKYIPFTLPSMPKTSNFLNFSLPSFSVPSFEPTRARPLSVNERKQVTSMYESPRRAESPHYNGALLSRANNGADQARSSPGPLHPSAEPIPLHQDPTASGTRSGATSQEAPIPGIQRRPTPQLRRSNSEGSLLLYRSKSFASSLGDDTRFENVSEQVNNRLKALKDSWQDANFRLPSLPTMPNFNFGAREDMFRSRNNIQAPRVTSGRITPAKQSVAFAASSTPSQRLSWMREPSSNAAGMSASAASTHPHFTRAVQNLEGDLVILGGYRGSVLRSAEPPNRQLWVPLKVGLNLRKVDLELGLDSEDEETEEDRIIPAGMLTNIGPVDIAKRLFKRLRASENAKNKKLRVHDYGYDWRLSPHISSRKLIEYLRALPCNQPDVAPEKRGAFILAHSLGGLITRHAINQYPELVAGVVYAGVPQTCVNILGPLRNGDDVMLSSRVLTAQVNFTIRTSFALLPLNGKCFINKNTKEEYPVDFFDVNTWKQYRLSPCIAPSLPHPNSVSNFTTVSGLLSAMSQALPSLPGRKLSTSRGSNGSTGNLITPSPSSTQLEASKPTTQNAAKIVADRVADTASEATGHSTGFTPQMSGSPAPETFTGQSNPATTVTIPYEKATEYLTRTLAAVKKFKQELAHRPEHTATNAYPPIALIYGKSTPTVYGAKVESREAIKRADAYDELAFASGDGVVLARAAQVPEGYSVVRGGVVSSDRGHVTLLGDLEAVGRCLTAVMGARRAGVGLGSERGNDTGKGKEKAKATSSG